MAKNKDSLNFLEGYKTTAIIILAGVVLIYLFSFTGFHFSVENIGDFGTIGDFFGGILNPIFALLALFALLATIKIQSKELSKSVKIMKAQHQSIKLQNFENTFFNMLNLHNKLRESLYYNKTSLKISGNVGAFVIDDSMDIDSTLDKQEIVLVLLKFFYQFIEHFNTLPSYKKYTYNNKSYQEEIWINPVEINQRTRTNQFYLMFHSSLGEIYGHYFNNIYQILKFISNSKIENQKIYSNLFRAQFSSSELELLFYNCVSDIGNQDFLPLLIEFEIFRTSTV